MLFMKQLIIVRHGKSSWENIGLRDHDRPLSSEGIQKTRKVAAFLYDNSIMPDLMLSSTAKRTLVTAEIICSAIKYDKESIVSKRALYLADEDDIYTELFALDNDIESVMVFGHNPGFTDFANQFVDPPIENLPTSGIVCIDLYTDKWEEISNSDYKVQFVVTPKMLK